MFKIKKSFVISASHKLELDYESKCTNRHGHSWTITVYFQSEELNKNGMIMDFAEIKHKIQDKLDHHYLNDVLVLNTTAENIAFWVCQQFDSCCYRVDVEEEVGSVATYIDEKVL